jgi:hypothetical protein
MRRYHHIGIPTTEAKPGETHLKHLKLFVLSHEKMSRRQKARTCLNSSTKSQWMYASTGPQFTFSAGDCHFIPVGGQ